MTTTMIEDYTAPNGCQYELGKDERGHFVRCWNEEGELHWEMRGTVLTDDGLRQTQKPYETEADARVEFEKWRK